MQGAEFCMGSKGLRLSRLCCSLLDKDESSQEEYWFLSYDVCIVFIVRICVCPLQGQQLQVFSWLWMCWNSALQQYSPRTIGHIISCVSKFCPQSSKRFFFCSFACVFLSFRKIGFHSSVIFSLCLTAWQSDLAMLSASAGEHVHTT